MSRRDIRLPITLVEDSTANIAHSGRTLTHCAITFVKQLLLILKSVFLTIFVFHFVYLELCVVSQMKPFGITLEVWFCLFGHLDPTT